MCRSSIHEKSFKTPLFFPSRLIEFPVNSNERWWWRGKAAIINHEHTALFFIWSVAAWNCHRAEIQPGRRWQYVWLWFGREAIVPEHIHRHLNGARALKSAFVWVRAALTANKKIKPLQIYMDISRLGYSNGFLLWKFIQLSPFAGEIWRLGRNKYEHIAFVL